MGGPKKSYSNLKLIIPQFTSTKIALVQSNLNEKVFDLKALE
jgi:hypothetical protein